MTVVKWSPVLRALCSRFSVNNSPSISPTSSKVRHTSPSSPPSTTMSAPEREQGAREKPRGKGVDRRPSADVLAEMEGLARQDRAKLSTPIPPAPRPPGRFFITRPRRSPANRPSSTRTSRRRRTGQGLPGRPPSQRAPTKSRRRSSWRRQTRLPPCPANRRRPARTTIITTWRGGVGGGGCKLID